MEKTITIQLQDLTPEQREEYGVTPEQIDELERSFMLKDKLGEYYDHLLYDGFWALHSRLTVGKANSILYALRNDMEIVYKKPYRDGYNPNKNLNTIDTY